MTFFNSLADGFKIIIIALCSLALIGEIFFACLCVSRRKAKVISVIQVLIAILCAFNVIRLANGGPILPHSALTAFLNTEMAVIITIAVNISLGSLGHGHKLLLLKCSTCCGSRRHVHGGIYCV